MKKYYKKPSIEIINTDSYLLTTGSVKEGETWVDGNATGCGDPATWETLEQGDEFCPNKP